MAQFSISEILTEYQKNPMGLDTGTPHFLWKIRQEEGSFIQSAYRICVRTSPERTVWDSGIVHSRNSAGIAYEGESLSPCTRYYIMLAVWDEEGGMAQSGEAWFETGLMDDTLSAWEGASWIGAPEKYVRPETMGVFVLRSRFRIEKGGSRAGIVFGAEDERLLDPRRNQYQIAGENYIRYEIDVSEDPAVLRIFRVGYHPEDRKDRPLCETRVLPFDREEGKQDETRRIITAENRYEEHEIRIEVKGNCAYTYIDGILTDAEMRTNFFGAANVEPRQLNPLGSNDTTTFPRLCRIGYYAGPGDRVCFPSGLEVLNERTPHARVVVLDPEGIFLEGGKDGLQKISDPGRHSLPMFRRQFDLPGKKVQAARLYITARGVYDCDINGDKVTETLLNPGTSQYDRHIMYQVYDVKELLQEGKNSIHVTLSSGWWCDAQTFVLQNYNYYGDRESFLAKLTVTYEDGSRSCLVTDTDHWEYYGEGPWLYSGLFQGEHYDARRGGWESADPALIGKPVVIEPAEIESTRTMPPGFGREWPRIDHSHAKLTGGMNSPVWEVDSLQAVSVTSPREGLYLYDLGQEIAGVPRIVFRGSPGERAVIRYGEMLYPDLPEYKGLEGMILTENYRDAESTDIYILRGDEEGEVFEPGFTFHGFRYIEITGVRNPPALEEVEGIQLSSVKEITGSLRTSNALLNRFIENVRWSQLCNFISIPTDCPQRNERMGWAGDTHVFCRTATYQSDTRIFYDRYLQMLGDLQEEDGQMPEIAPVGGGFGGITYECAMVFIVWELYQQYGTTDIIEKNYDSMRRWVDLMHDKGLPGQVWVGPINDWLSPEQTDDFLLWNAFYYRSVYLLGRMADVVHRQEDAMKYLKHADEVKAYWNRTFVDEETGRMKKTDGSFNDTQCAYALPLVYGVVEERFQRTAYEHLAEQIRKKGCTVQTGFFGTGVLNPALSAGGYHDLACELMQQTEYPSWLYSVTQGATTIWERWNSYTKENGFGGNNAMNSFNHYSLGSVVSWIYEWVLGIQRDENDPGYRHFFLKPQMESFDYAEGGFETVYGRIESRWKKTEEGYCYECLIPCNTTADLHLEKNGTVIDRRLNSGRYKIQITL